MFVQTCWGLLYRNKAYMNRIYIYIYIYKAKTWYKVLCMHCEKKFKTKRTLSMLYKSAIKHSRRKISSHCHSSKNPARSFFNSIYIYIYIYNRSSFSWFYITSCKVVITVVPTKQNIERRIHTYLFQSEKANNPLFKVSNYIYIYILYVSLKHLLCKW